MFPEQTDNLWLSQFAVNIADENLHGQWLVKNRI